MHKNFLTHFPFMSLVLAGQLLFFAIFVGALFWVFRRGSTNYYQRLSQLPIDEGGSRHE